MNTPDPAEQRAEALIDVHCPRPGGPSFVRLGGVIDPPLLLGPYENPAIARADAQGLRKFVAAVIREGRRP
jgi:hypothetical protein